MRSRERVALRDWIRLVLRPRRTEHLWFDGALAVATVALALPAGNAWGRGGVAAVFTGAAALRFGLYWIFAKWGIGLPLAESDESPGADRTFLLRTVITALAILGVIGAVFLLA